MELKSFVTKALIELISAINDVEKISKQEVTFARSQDNKCVTFDIAVTAENTSKGTVEGGITVLGLNLGGDSALESKSSCVSRIAFGVYVDDITMEEREASRQRL